MLDDNSAVYLLTEFGVQEILPTLLNILGDSDGNTVDCFHDVIDMNMARICGRLADEPGQLRTRIFNPNAPEIARRDALEAIVWMVTEGKLDRSAAITLLLQWLKESRENTSQTLANHHLGRIEHPVVELSDWDWHGSR